mmetsp:Transcript_69887/g.176098  ORF Transcript_69887/g.176098 Transcript_69887/m.176098 type:complete len:104 (-) Transcript_69887:162-473(-)
MVLELVPELEAKALPQSRTFPSNPGSNCHGTSKQSCTGKRAPACSRHRSRGLRRRCPDLRRDSERDSEAREQEPANAAPAAAGKAMEPMRTTALKARQLRRSS